MMVIMEKMCMLLVYFDKGIFFFLSEIKEYLEGYDVEVKVDVMKKVIMLLFNGEIIFIFFIIIVWYVFFFEDYIIQKFLLLYLEIIDKMDLWGKVLLEMIFICQNFWNNLQYFNEYI